MDRLHIANKRTVVTFEPEGWPSGIFTCYFNSDGGCVLEHIINFNGPIQRFIKAGLDKARRLNLPYICFYIPNKAPQAKALMALAKRYKFVPYFEDDHLKKYVRRPPFDSL